VVVATFESGGFGADTAAPAVRRIMATLFNVQNKASAPSNKTAGVNPYG
jgi:cell division protein FtsI/penicillin-binding protein 2